MRMTWHRLLSANPPANNVYLRAEECTAPSRDLQPLVMEPSDRPNLESHWAPIVMALMLVKVFTG